MEFVECSMDIAELVQITIFVHHCMEIKKYQKKISYKLFLLNEGVHIRIDEKKTKLKNSFPTKIRKTFVN